MTKEKQLISFRPSKENKNLIPKLAELAKKDNRTLNNYIETILLKHINHTKK